MGKKRVAIVGMHRGGTSAIAGVIHRLGFFMGDDILPASDTNKTGYFEDALIVDYNNLSMGYNWYMPDLCPNSPGRALLIHRLRDVFDKHDAWAIKDPRLCYTLPWVRAEFQDIHVVSVYRDPWFAAHSLSRRDGMSFSAALDISLSYLQEMIRNTMRVGAFRIRYDDLILTPKSSVIALSDWLGVPFRESAVDFIDPSMATWERKALIARQLLYGSL